MANPQNRAIEVKGLRYSLMSLKLLSEDFNVIQGNIRDVTRQAPAFFKNTPVIVDFSSLDINIEFDFNSLFKIIRQGQLLPVAVCGVEPGLREKMQSIGVPIVEQAKAAADQVKASGDADGRTDETKGEVRTPGKVAKTMPGTVVVELSAESPGQLYSEHGDLIVIGDVGSTRELIAAGNIHVYGALHGRAAAGVNGDINARIFCTSLSAEHLSIAGIGLSLKGVSARILSTPLQVVLKDGKLVAAPISSKKCSLDVDTGC
ncbi:septum site-determining protein MinC [Chromatiales bacterium (ex Bugula neritina AB1)]|nr:septum site-determining protein MinC [Chromatiales bacterium (ex Bugula neritina AB1)]